MRIPAALDQVGAVLFLSELDCPCSVSSAVKQGHGLRRDHFPVSVTGNFGCTHPAKEGPLSVALPQSGAGFSLSTSRSAMADGALRVRGPKGF